MSIEHYLIAGLLVALPLAAMLWQAARGRYGR